VDWAARVIICFRSTGKFSFHHHEQNGSEVHLISSPMDTRGSSLCDKAVGM